MRETYVLNGSSIAKTEDEEPNKEAITKLQEGLCYDRKESR